MQRHPLRDLACATCSVLPSCHQTKRKCCIEPPTPNPKPRTRAAPPLRLPDGRELLIHKILQQGRVRLKYLARGFCKSVVGSSELTKTYKIRVSGCFRGLALAISTSPEEVLRVQSGSRAQTLQAKAWVSMVLVWFMTTLDAKTQIIRPSVFYSLHGRKSCLS